MYYNGFTKFVQPELHALLQALKRCHLYNNRACLLRCAHHAPQQTCCKSQPVIKIKMPGWSGPVFLPSCVFQVSASHAAPIRTFPWLSETICTKSSQAHHSDDDPHLHYTAVDLASALSNLGNFCIRYCAGFQEVCAFVYSGSLIGRCRAVLSSASVRRLDVFMQHSAADPVL